MTSTHETLPPPRLEVTPGSATLPAGLSATHVDEERGEPTVALDPGDRAGRYVILDRVGAGGMGVVYAAYDAELDRRVALKLLATSVGGSRGTDGEARLLREAKAMARVTHPNVVTVHDVGVIRGEVFVAMEFVEGPTLDAWVEAHADDWRAILDMFAGAGRGLAAAHAVGLVHRDFKPHNVMVDGNVRARVMDFGLARTVESTRSLVDSAPAKMGATASAETALTMTGSLMGTPAYMSPEQFEGRAVDARADQFGFCVALWESLYGERPFAGSSVPELVWAVLQAEIREPKSHRGVPARVHRALRRGLATDPARRFASMDALLAELDRARAPRGRRVAIALGVVASTVAAVALARGVGGVDDPCPTLSSQALRILDDERMTAVAAAFDRSPLGYAADARRAVEETASEFADRWARQRLEACEATHLRREQSAQLLDLRMQCLLRQERQFEATYDLLAGGDADVIAKAVELAATLPDPGHCADVESLHNRVPLPRDEDARRRIETHQATLAEIVGLREAGRIDEAQAKLRPVLEDARTLDYAPLLAETLLSSAQLVSIRGQPSEAQTLMIDAIDHAIAGRDDRLAATIAARLVSELGATQEGAGEALRWARVADGFLRRVGGDQKLEADLLYERANAHIEAGRIDEALRLAHEGLDAAEGAYGETSPNLARAIEQVGMTLWNAGRASEGLPYLERGLEIERARWGNQHPRVATSLSNLGILYGTLDRVDDCARALEEAVRINEVVYGEDNVQIAPTLTNLGEVRAMQDRHEETLALNERAMALRSAAYGPGHTEVALNAVNAGKALVALGRHDEARQRLERALSSYEAVDGDHPRVGLASLHLAAAYEGLGRLDDAVAATERAKVVWATALGERHPNVGVTLVNLGERRVAAGDAEAGLAELHEGIDILEATYGPDHGDVLTARGQLGAALLTAGRAPRAVEVLDELLPLLLARDAPPHSIARIELVLAKSLWSTGRDRSRALELAESAKGRLQPLGERFADDHASAQQWLATHRGRSPSK